MKVSRHFIVTTALILLIGGSLYYFFAKSVSFFEKVNAENLSQIDQYLYTNYSFKLDLDKDKEEAARIYCDQTVATSSEQGEVVAYPCQNSNPTNKIVIGWADKNMKYGNVMKSLANEQLYWKMYPSPERLDGTLSCSEADDYTSYKDGAYDMDCLLVTTGAEKLYSSTIFFESRSSKVTLFVSVLNTSQKSSPQKVKQELHTLLAHTRKNEAAISMLSNVFRTAKADEGVTQATSSTAFSTESDAPPRNGSSNSVTNESGSVIDATTCDVTDTTSCYPLYCLSSDDVWNYSLNRCVEPKIVPAAGVESCPLDTPIWDGRKCRPLTGNIISSDSCTIEVGGNSCAMKVFWSVENPKGNVSAKRILSATESLIIGEGTSNTITHSFPYRPEPQKVALYDGVEKVNEGTFITRCSRGGWDDKSASCVDPSVAETRLQGEYYETPGKLIFTCDNSDSFSVRTDNDLTVATGTYLGETSIPLVRSGNYAVTCSKGTYTGNSSVRFYNAPPPPAPHVTFSSSPRTIGVGETTTLSWSIDFPRDTCSLSAKVVCKASGCSDDEKNFETELNQSLLSDRTDETDPEGSRLISTSLKEITGSHKDNDFKTTGQKTVAVMHTTDFSLGCGIGPDVKKRVYIRTNK